MPLQITPFIPEHIPAAAQLLAARHTCDRETLPELPARFENPEACVKAIEAALRRKHASGFAASDGEKLIAYLIGDMLIENIWGRSGWVRTAGCAYDPTYGVEPVRDLYAALGEGWLRYGIFFHFALVPISDPALVHAWFSMSFGIEQIHALLDLYRDAPPLPELPKGVEIRKAEKADRQHLADMSDVIWRQQVQAPTWAVMMPEAVAENVAGWAELVDEADVIVWLAFKDGQLAGTQGYWPFEQADDNLHIPENAQHMSVAGTKESARGQGISTLLTKYGLAQAKAAGAPFIETDWRSANLLASRFWPKQGFKPVVYRLVRRIDSRIAWAKGEVE